MSETLAHHQPANHDIVNLAAASLSAAPDLTEPERTARFQTVVRGATALEPADPTQTMLATLILGHHLAIMDGFRDLARLTLTPTEAAKARMVTVAQTKLVLQIAREMRVARKEAPAQRAAGQTAGRRGEFAQGSAGDAGYDASMAKLMSTYTATLAALEHTDSLSPTVAEKAMQALSEVLSPAPGATPREAPPAPVTGSRAQRRAMMKRRGEFKRTG
jgi:hypothetical protein